MDMRTQPQWHSSFMAMIAARMKPGLYVEIGVGQGHTFEAVKPYCGRIVGVDSNPGVNGDDIRQMTSDEFFVSCGDQVPAIELALIDADHESGQVLRDFDNVWARTALNGLVAIHDTFPENDSYKAKVHCSDSYLVPAEIRRRYADAEVVTLPFPPGLTLVRKCADA